MVVLTKVHKAVTAVLLTLTLLSGTATAAAAAEISSEPVDAGYTVLHVTAAQIRQQGAYEAINAALVQARDHATDANPYKIIVEPGEYVLKDTITNEGQPDSDDVNVPYIYSNTWLVLNGVTLKRGIHYNMLCTAYKDTNGEKIAGYATRNVIIDGGTFDSDACESVTTLKLGHARNVMMRNVTIKNTRNAHMMEIAAVDGLIMTGCTFDTQALDPGKAGEEAVQLDVCQKNHMNHYLNEDLPLQNVTIERCTFRNCPTGIGSHTSVFNAPHTNMNVRGCRFENMSVSAVKTLSWKDSAIEGNVIQNAPCGIIVRELVGEGSGTYRSSVIAAESGGKTVAHYPETYQKPVSNLRVNNNIITAGNITNPYSPNSAKYAIAVLGSRVVNSTQYGTEKNGGGLPKGDYWCNGVKVTDNLITVTGDGVHTEYTCNIDIETNVIHHDGASDANHNDNGVSLLNSVSAANIRKNYITDPSNIGVRVGKGCAAKDINDNEVYNPYYYGIGLDGAQVTTLSTNEVRNAGIGICLYNAANVSYRIIGNRLVNCGGGVQVNSGCYALKAEKNLFGNCSWGLDFSGSGSYADNVYYSQSLNAVTPKPYAVTLPVGGATRVAKVPSPLENGDTYSYSSSKPAVALVNKDTGRITALAAGSAVVTIKSSSGVTATVPVTVTRQQPTGVLGDVDNDGYVNSMDNALIAGYVSRTKGYETVNAAQADVNNDGNVNAKDRIILARHIERVKNYGTLPKDVTGETDGEGYIVFGNPQGQRGQTVDMVVTMQRNPGIATVELDLAYDTKVLTLTGITDHGLSVALTPEHAAKQTAACHLSWVNDLAQRNSTDTGRMATLHFKIADNAPAGVYPVTVNTAATEIYDKNLYTVPFRFGTAEVVVNGTPADVSGAVTGGTGEATVRLLPQNPLQPILSTVTQNGAYRFAQAPGGVYTLQITKDGCVAEERAVTVDGKAQTVTIALRLKGDANGDGTVTIDDVTHMQRHIAEQITVRDFAAADVNGDGAVTIDDATTVQRYLAEMMATL